MGAAGSEVQTVPSAFNDPGSAAASPVTVTVVRRPCSAVTTTGLAMSTFVVSAAGVTTIVASLSAPAVPAEAVRVGPQPDSTTAAEKPAARTPITVPLPVSRTSLLPSSFDWARVAHP